MNGSEKNANVDEAPWPLGRPDHCRAQHYSMTILVLSKLTPLMQQAAPQRSLTLEARSKSGREGRDTAQMCL